MQKSVPYTENQTNPLILIINIAESGLFVKIFAQKSCVANHIRPPLRRDAVSGGNKTKTGVITSAAKQSVLRQQVYSRAQRARIAAVGASASFAMTPFSFMCRLTPECWCVRKPYYGRSCPSLTCADSICVWFCGR